MSSPINTAGATSHQANAVKFDRASLLWTFAGVVLLAAAGLSLPVGFIWNRTASEPTGLYRVAPLGAPARGVLVAYRPTSSEAAWIEAHGYTGPGWPLIKRIAAVEGDEVCRFDQTVFVNGAAAATAMAVDSTGARLPAWKGCRSLNAGEVFLLADHPRSIDGRYFGIQRAARLLGRAVPWPSRPTSGPDCPKDQPLHLYSAGGLAMTSACSP
jgi:conjugative transfer signal peptidase TraF